MQGAIRNRDVLVHGFTIVRHFGLAAYWRCVRAVFRHDAATFLDALYSGHHPGPPDHDRAP
jgi:hypothetical protein